MITRRSINQYLKAPAIIRTPGLLMRVKVHREESNAEAIARTIECLQKEYGQKVVDVQSTPTQRIVIEAIERDQVAELQDDFVIAVAMTLRAEVDSRLMASYPVGIKPGPDGEPLFSASHPEFLSYDPPSQFSEASLEVKEFDEATLEGSIMWKGRL